MAIGIDFLQSTATAPSPLVAGIVVALPEELSTLTSKKLVRGECLALSPDILVIYAGAGPINAEQSAKLLISKGVNCLISWGCAAALSPRLAPGDLLVPEQVLSEQQLVFNVDRQWLEHLQHVLKLPFKTGMLVESSGIVADSDKKLRIHEESAALALDMESVAVIKIAQQAGLPAVVIRAIADPVKMDLPQAVVRALNSQGEIELNKLLRFLLFHPWEIPALIKLGLHFHAAQKTLKIVAKQLKDIICFK